jgi:uncharacterized protein YlbG (UPF0298 family)
MTMSTVSVRISQEEKRQLQRYGKLSDALRQGMKLYLNNKKSEELFCKLQKLQAENPIKTSTEEEVRLIREDRVR